LRASPINLDQCTEWRVAVGEGSSMQQLLDTHIEAENKTVEVQQQGRRENARQQHKSWRIGQGTGHKWNLHQGPEKIAIEQGDFFMHSVCYV